LKLRQIQSYVSTSSQAPIFGTETYQDWLEFTDALGFLTASVKGSVPIYISIVNKYAHFYVYTVFVPRANIGEDYADILLDWNLPASAGWAYGTARNPETGAMENEIFPPLSHIGNSVLEGAEPIVFLRHFDGYESPSYVELNQRFAHINDLHWVSEAGAYCRLNETGDRDRVVQVDSSGGSHLVTVERADLDFYMSVGHTVAIRVFDVIRTIKPEDVPGLERVMNVYRDATNEIFARHTLAQPPEGESRTAWLRGAQVIRTQVTGDEMAQAGWGPGYKARRYESFLALDFKHDKVQECSADPAQLGNYFVKSDLPFETTPAFFKPEVLARYQQDPDKYTFEWGTLRCRGAWSLPYGVNDTGQIFAYLIDLSRLPHSEQVYWKSFNEVPDGGISKRAYTTDFLGEWDTEYDPLTSLQDILANFPKANINSNPIAIWAAPAGTRPQLLHDIVTESSKEWKDQLLELAKLLPEGLNLKALRAVATQAQQYDKDNEQDKKLGTIGLLQRCLISLGEEEEPSKAIIKPLRDVYELRSSIVAHAGKVTLPTDPKGSYRDLLARCDKAMHNLAALITAGKFNIPQAPAEKPAPATEPESS
jgi:hypothetical protein